MTRTIENRLLFISFLCAIAIILDNQILKLYIYGTFGTIYILLVILTVNK